MNPLGEALMNDPFLATPEPMGNRRDIDQALSLLQLSGGSGSSKVGRRERRRGGGGEVVYPGMSVGTWEMFVVFGLYTGGVFATWVGICYMLTVFSDAIFAPTVLVTLESSGGWVQTNSQVVCHVLSPCGFPLESFRTIGSIRKCPPQLYATFQESPVGSFFFFHGPVSAAWLSLSLIFPPFPSISLLRRP